MVCDENLPIWRNHKPTWIALVKEGKEGCLMRAIRKDVCLSWVPVQKLRYKAEDEKGPECLYFEHSGLRFWDASKDEGVLMNISPAKRNKQTPAKELDMIWKVRQEFLADLESHTRTFKLSKSSGLR